MPHGDLLNDAALGALLEAGIEGADLDKGIPLPILDTHHISSLEVAKSVVFEESNNAAGVIDEADYNKWPDKGGSFLLLSPSKDQVRILGKTVRIPGGPFVVSVNTSPELKEKAIDFLFNVAPKDHKLALLALNCKGFAKPMAAKAYEPFGKIHRKLHPPKAEPPNSQDADPATQPSDDGSRDAQ
jgi:ABC-type phosphate/phosphonate transport system substrate-binding protein